MKILSGKNIGRLRKTLMIRKSCKWNVWIRNITSYLGLFIIFCVIIVTSSESNAGIFRKGPMLPWRHKQWEQQQRPETPATPNPPPIITPSLIPAPAPTPTESESTKPTKPTEEEINAIKMLLSPDETKPISNLPPWLPLGGLAGGGLLTLLALARKGFSLVKGF